LETQSNVASWLESFRDRVVHRSQVGKRRLDATFARRDLDLRHQELGERFLSLVQQGTAAAPQELAALVQEIREMEDRLRCQLQDIAALESEG
jgi:hypothetical protein